MEMIVWPDLVGPWPDAWPEMWGQRMSLAHCPSPRFQMYAAVFHSPPTFFHTVT
jgi:hypothetical protein